MGKEEHINLAILIIAFVLIAISFIFVILNMGFFQVSVPHLELYVSPPGYPQFGESWIITVYSVNKTVFKPAENATVIIDTKVKDGLEKTYQLLTDDQGQASFQYREEYSGISFRGFLKGYASSEKIVLSEYYVPPLVINGLASLSFITGTLSLAGKYFLRRRTYGPRSVYVKISDAIIFLVLFISWFIVISSEYSRFFQGTAWGYPNNIWNNVITVERLKYVYLFVITLYFLLCFLACLEIRRGK